jgi:23S rRNA pseudouridine955/2504/2580 synthase
VPAKTEIWRLDTRRFDDVGDISLVKTKIYTGRMHQIRAHLSHIGHPIVGDIMYGDDKVNKYFHKNYKINRQLLHSWRYGFYDKFKNKYISFEAPIPEDFKKLFPR